MGPKMQEVAGALRLDTELSADSAAYIEELYEQYLVSPTSVLGDWREYFDQYPKGDQPHGSVREQFLLLGRNANRVQPVVQGTVSTEHERRQIGVLQLIAGYRNRGHQKAKLDPLGLAKREEVPDLDLTTHNLTKSDLDTVFNTGNLAIGKDEATLSEMVNAMEATYCGSIGAEYMHIVDTKEKRWIQQRLESVRGQYNLTTEQKKGARSCLRKYQNLRRHGQVYITMNRKFHCSCSKRAQL
jgi:2-oxoglutarate dehydrogenase E1 component